MADAIRAGNIKLMLCFAFYLAWWIMGFNPRHPVRGMKSAWLLVPAAILGIWALVNICQGLDFLGGLVPSSALVAGGIVSYVALVGITSGLFRRPVTTELFIIVLWATVMLLEINTLVSWGLVSSQTTWILIAICLLGTAGSIVCYQLFYGLDAGPAFVDGAIPLLLACAITGIVTLCAS